MSKSNANQPQVITCYLGTQSTAGTYPLFSLSRKFVVTSMKLLDGVGIAADNTNYVSLTVKKGATAIATLDTRAANQGAVTALVGKSFVMDAAFDGGVAEPLPAGDYSYTYAEGGSGTLSSAQLVVEGYYK